MWEDNYRGGTNMLKGKFKSIYEDIIHDLLLDFMCANNSQPYHQGFIDDVTIQFFIEIMKMDYDAAELEKSGSFRQFRMENGCDSEDQRKREKRQFEKIKNERRQMIEQLEHYFGYSPKELLISDIHADDMGAKLKGYTISPVQYEEIQLRMQYPIFEKVSGGQFGDSKKISNADFKRLNAEYDELIRRLYLQMDSDEMVIKNTFSYFVLSWKYPLEFIYQAAEYIDGKELPEEYINQLGLYCLPLNDPDNDFHADNRFLMSRNRYLDLLIYADEYERKRLEWQYVQQLYALQFLKSVIGQSVLEQITEITVASKAKFIREHYWIWDHKIDKEWSQRKVVIARKIFKTLSG